VNDADRETWAAIDRGERLIDWEAWFGHLDGADYLTPEGKNVALRAVADLTAFFGPTWLDRALQPDLGSHRSRVPGLGGSSPVLAWTSAQRPDAFIESIRWWASLQLLVEDRVPGFETVRRDARNDLSTQRLTHTLTQARLAAIGAFLGASVTVEPEKPGGPGDVLLRTGHEEVFLEIVTFGPDENRELDECRQHRHMMHLMALAAPAIYWEGYVPGYLNKAEEARWISATTDAAAQCVRTGQPVEVPGPEGHVLVVRPGVAPAGTRMIGPELTMDFSTRLARVLQKKGAQTRGAGIAWIWIEDYGGVHAVHPFTRMPLAAKTTTLARLASNALADRPHVAGIAWSGAMHCSQLPPDEQAQTPTGLAFQRGLPIAHLRQTVIVSRHLILPGQLRILGQLCDREPSWLDWALHRLGIDSGVRSLLTQPPQQRTPLLWTPATRR
jgi:hypothetical protein